MLDAVPESGPQDRVRVLNAPVAQRSATTATASPEGSQCRLNVLGGEVGQLDVAEVGEEPPLDRRPVQAIVDGRRCKVG